jgi:hypothetical protein
LCIKRIVKQQADLTYVGVLDLTQLLVFF